MNLKNFKGSYSIGLDMGTNSVGWAVVDESGKLMHFKKLPTWGSRLFDAANTAAAARTPRSQRRRYIRRRWRLDLLQGFFKADMQEVDPDFFTRLNQSRLLKEDRKEDCADYHWPIFNGSDFTEPNYYEQFPTIYHLRKFLVETDQQADLRLVYLAMHNIVKHRGNFLREGDLRAENANPDEAIAAFGKALADWCEFHDFAEPKVDQKAIAEAFSEERTSRSQIVDDIKTAIKVELDEPSNNKKCTAALSKAMIGLSAEFKDIFGDNGAEKTKGYLSKEDDVETIREGLADEDTPLFDALCGVHSAFVLQGILAYAPGETISANMIVKYEQYGKDLRVLKNLVREFKDGAAYDEFFRGPVYETNKKKYDKARSSGYTAYNLGKTSYDDFAKKVKKLFAGTGAEEDARYAAMIEAFGEQRFLRRLKTSDNGSIPHQLHLEELRAIIENQGRFYPFLKEDASKIESLVTFRIPYYVGPLTGKNAAKDAHGDNRFQWSERKPGMEDAVITPWNWEEVIDRNASAEKFIRRMTGMCTYLQGEEVLPRNSLLYEEYCLRNELNGIHYADSDGDKKYRLTPAQCDGVVTDLGYKGSLTNNKIADWLVREGDAVHPRVSGGQGANGLESKLAAHIFFAKDILGVDKLDRADYPMIEEIILWNTLFEDRSILKEKLEQKYGAAGEGRLDASQIKKICKKRFTGWGRLSRKFLTGLKVDTECGSKSIMDILREGDPNSGNRRGKSLVMMEILHDDQLGFQQKVDDFNQRYYAEKGAALAVNDLPGSPALRRSLNQAVKIVDEIVGIVGHAPANIFIEVTRDDDRKKKGNRTKRRYDQLLEATQKFKEDNAAMFSAGVMSELRDNAANLDEEALYLYFAQHGKCLYSGKSIDLAQLLSGSGDYEVDHIIPRCYIKDDSLENKALVIRDWNQRKKDSLLLDDSIRQRMSSTWRALHDAGLIGDKKYNNLKRDVVDDKAMRGFIARQLVETSQIVKLMQSLLGARYAQDEVNVVPVKASASRDLREALKLAKCREANDYHHAHDAFLACRIGLFVQLRYPKIYDDPRRYTDVMRKLVRKRAEELAQGKSEKEAQKLPNWSGMIANSFMKSSIDKETGEILWDADAEAEGIKKSLNYRQCFITRMPYEDAGAFWDATIYSPRDPKKGKDLSLPLKDGLDPKKYGGYSREGFAYFFIYEAKDKKGKRVFRFEPVPISIASHVGNQGRSLVSYAQELAAVENLEFVSVVRPKVLKRQLIEVDGERFFITGKREMRNAAEIAFSTDEINLMDWFASTERDGKKRLNIDASVSDISNELTRYAQKQSSKVLTQIKFDELKLRILALDDESESLILLLRIVSLLNGANNMVDLTQVGGAAHAGSLNPSFAKMMTNPKVDFCIIDQSVTGMFERKTRVGL
jgi:CRISPR-associated endonuclease Csn1